MKSINWKNPNEKREGLPEQILKLTRTLAEKDQEILEHIERQRILRNTIRNLEDILSRTKQPDSFIPIKTERGLLRFGSN